MLFTFSVALCLGSISLIAARDHPRPVAEETASLRGEHAGDGMDETGLALFWLFIGLTGASIVCSLLVLCLRQCILKLLPPRPTRPESSTASINSRTAASQAAADHNNPGSKTIEAHPREAEFLRAVEVHQPGGTIVVGVPLP